MKWVICSAVLCLDLNSNCLLHSSPHPLHRESWWAASFQTACLLCQADLWDDKIREKPDISRVSGWKTRGHVSKLAGSTGFRKSPWIRWRGGRKSGCIYLSHPHSRKHAGTNAHTCTHTHAHARTNNGWNQTAVVEPGESLHSYLGHLNYLCPLCIVSVSVQPNCVYCHLVSVSRP